jgi:hypothetical protein
MLRMQRSVTQVGLIDITAGLPSRVGEAIHRSQPEEAPVDYNILVIYCRVTDFL